MDEELIEDERVKEDLANSPEIKGWIAEERSMREKFMRKVIKENMKWHHKPMFWLYEALSDFFVPRVKIIHPESYQEGTYGVELYGKKYLCNYKPTQTHE